MTWISPTIANHTPAAVREFLDEFVFAQLKDVHAMMRPQSDAETVDVSDFRYSSVTMLLQIVAGIGRLLKGRYSTSQRFCAVLQQYYPWEADASPIEEAQLLYRLSQNPLAYAVGMRAPVRPLGGNSARRSKTIQVYKAPLDMHDLEMLERATMRPNVAATTFIRGGAGLVLNATGFYWGVRRMIGRLTDDGQAMAAARAALLGGTMI